ncbi:protein mono-ADP-ribosyltransferase PARP9 isoform X2 [Lissotriton helveticus]
MLQENTVAVPIEDAVYDVLKQSNCLSEIIKMKFDCEAFLMDSAWTTQSRTVSDKKVYETTIGKTGRVNLSVWMGDLTQQRVAAVVNAANEDLAHTGGLALAIVTAGGIEIEKASKVIINKCKKVATGECVITTGGNLPCKYVIHAVGPNCSKWGHSHGQCQGLLKKAITNIFEGIANGMYIIDSVAIPALSSGIFNFPLQECAEIIVRHIKELADRDRLGVHLKEIRLMNNDEKTVNAVKKACEETFGRNGSGSFLGSSPKSLSSQSSDTIRINNVCLQIKKGHIEDQQTAVIVNSVDKNRDLSDGFISRAILSKAGFEMQHEINRIPLSTVMKTRGYKLPCEWVYHLIVLEAHSNGAEKGFRQVVSKCLENTAKEGIKSISFPAIGTGVLNFSKNQVANIMISEAIHFAKQHSEKKLHVCFVIYPKDDDTFKAFLDELQSQRPKQNTSQGGASADSAMASSFSRTFEPKSSKPTVHLGGINLTDVHEAEAWIQHTLKEHHNGLTIENNHIIYFGAQENKELVNKLDPSISLLETVDNGRAHIRITGLGPAVIKAALEIEKLLYEVQQQYELEQMKQLEQLADHPNKEYGEKRESITLPKSIVIKKAIESDHQQYKDKENEFRKAGLLLVKMEQIQNPLLKIIYQSRKDYITLKRQKSVISTLYHQVPAQFCNQVCRIGFQRLSSHPHEPRYGAGMYFSKSLKRLQATNKQMSVPDQYVYIFQAEVITGSFTKGKESYILPPPVGEDCMDLHDSVVDVTTAPETYVIFNSSQAVPLFLFTCKII